MSAILLVMEPTINNSAVKSEGLSPIKKFVIVIICILLSVSAAGALYIWYINNNLEKFKKESGIDITRVITDTVSAVTATTTATTSLQNQVEKATSDSLLSMTVPENKIENIGFYGFGDIGTTTIDVLRDAITEQIGTPSFYVGHVQGDIPKEFYDEKRKQYNGDNLWNGMSGYVSSSNKQIRAIGVFNIDLYTSVGKDTRPYIMSRAFPNVNNTVISLYRLHNLSDTSNDPAPKELFESRAKKLILRNLGASVGLQATASANDPTCIMSKADTLADLDKKTGKLCSDEALYFKKALLSK